MRIPPAVISRAMSFGTTPIFLLVRTGLIVIGLIGFSLAQIIDPAHLAGLRWRNIGPFRGGRVSAVTGIISQPDVFYIGLPQGGVWKTTSAGQTWYPVFDAVKDVSSVGSMQVAQSDPNIVYAGTGEISGGGQGNGVYRSADAGRTWTHIGLDDSKVVPSLLVDPHNPDLVIAAALGISFGEGGQKGVFRSTDGGKTWKRTLMPAGDGGVQHIAWAYDNPSVIYALSKQPFRFAPPPPPGSTAPPPKAPPGPELYKSTDEGLTWKVVAGKGLPKLQGRMCTAVAQGTNSQRLFLIGTFGLYRSDDGGANWTQVAVNDTRIANGQGEYTSGVYIDPKNPDIVYTLATCVYRSSDGGKTFAALKGAPGGDDPQQMWIDPADGTHILLGGDQGAVVSLDAGKTWGSWYNQPTGQVYHVSTDTQFPYWVYATQQDSGTIGTSSRGNLGAITPLDWTPHPGNEGGYVVVDPLNPRVSYAVGPVGGIIRVTNPSGQWVQIEPNMSPDSKLRSWSGLMAFSPKNPHELILAAQYLLATTDGGAHWKQLSPDLTFDPEAKTPQEKQAAQYAAVMSFSASPASAGVIWAGTSNGLLYVTKDHGKSWESVNIGALSGKRRGMIQHIESSPQDPATAYIAARSQTDGKQHLFRTHDFGQTYIDVSKGLPSDIVGISVLRADPKKSGLLFAVSGKNVLVSFNEGESWQKLDLNLPTTQLSDLTIHENDLVLGTYGRGIWILDDFSPLRQISPTTVAEKTHLFKPADAYRLLRNTNDDTPFPPEVPHAENPPLGAVIYYSLAAKPSGTIRLEIVDSHGKVVRHLSSAPIEPYDDPPPAVPEFWREILRPMPTEVGLNRINWNIRYDTPLAFNHDLSDVMGAMAGDTPAAIEGPLALPGTYTVRLTVDGKTYAQSFVVKNDPRSTSTPRDLALEHQFRMTIVAAAQESYDGYQQVSAMRAALALVINSKPPTEVAKAAKAFDDKLGAVGGSASHGRKFYGPPTPNSFANLNGYLLTRLEAFNYGDIAPTEAMKETWGSDWSKLKAVSDQWRAIIKKDLPAFNTLIAKSGISPISVTGPALLDPPAPKKRYIPIPEPPPAPGTGGTTMAVPIG